MFRICVVLDIFQAKVVSTETMILVDIAQIWIIFLHNIPSLTHYHFFLVGGKWSFETLRLQLFAPRPCSIHLAS